jgi:transcription antitermination factor NusG
MPVLPLEPFVFPEDLFQCTPGIEEASARWWVLQTRPRLEKSLARRLLSKHASFFLPLHAHRWRTQGRWLCSHNPLFPGYLFLHGDSEARLLAMQTNLVALCLPVVDQEQLWDDLSRVHRLITSGAPLTPEDRLQVGDPVEIIGGPLAGLEGKILRHGSKLRFCVEVQLLQRGVSVDIDRSMLRPGIIAQGHQKVLS